jgi:hypothetical protein
MKKIVYLLALSLINIPAFTMRRLAGVVQMVRHSPLAVPTAASLQRNFLTPARLQMLVNQRERLEGLDICEGYYRSSRRKALASALAPIILPALLAGGFSKASDLNDGLDRTHVKYFSLQ